MSDQDTSSPSGDAASRSDSPSQPDVESQPKTKSPRKAKSKTSRKKADRSGKKLVIVESPAKAKTISKFAGKGFTVKASFGHVRDLPKSSLGINVENNFQPKYVNLQDKIKVLRELRTLADKAPEVYLAPDPDREGEAIAWHLAQALKLDDDRIRRVTFNEITKKAVTHAFQNPGKINMARVNSQQARRILDRIVGYKLSPLLWQKLRKRGLSAGRVQSAALRLVCEREEAIRAFTPEEYWRIFALIESDHGRFVTEMKTRDGKKFRPVSESDARAVLDAVTDKPFTVTRVTKRTIRIRPYPPFATSQLQQAASSRLGFTPKKTMRIAQQLYEGIAIGPEGSQGLITYMRTDSFRLSTEALDEIRGYIAETFGEQYLPDRPNFYKSRTGAQEAHEAIRPTSALRNPDRIKQYLTADQYKLYRLIWQRTVASQMPPAVYDQTSIDMMCDIYGWTSSGRILVFDGYLKVLGDKHLKASEKDMETGDEPDELNGQNGNGESPASSRSAELSLTSVDIESQTLPPIAEGESLRALRIDPQQKFTQPPPRYTEAGLIKILEREGIGRPSTYADIISKILDRGYAVKEKRAFRASVLGMIVNSRLIENFPSIMDLKFTRFMESQLDKVEEQQVSWTEVLKEFYQPFMDNLEKASTNMQDYRVGEPSDVSCPKCGSPMTLHIGRYGPYLWCTNRDESGRSNDDNPSGDDKTYCNNRISVGPDGQPIVAVEPETTDFTCPKCGAPNMIKKVGRFGPYVECANETCHHRISLDKQGNLKEKKLSFNTNVPCPKCGAEMILRQSRRGPFFGCAKYPRCRGTRRMIDELKEPYNDALAKGDDSIRLELPPDHPVFHEKEEKDVKDGKKASKKESLKKSPNRKKKKAKTQRKQAVGNPPLSDTES